MSDEHVFHSRLGARLPVIASGKGVWLWDTDGNRYLDACGGAMVVTIGHGVPEVAEAAAKQLREVAFAHRTQFTNVPLQRLADRLAERAPGDLDLFFPVSGGSEAVETAIKLAHVYHRERGLPEKRRVVARWQSYHGNTLGALSATGHAARRHDYGSLLLPFPHVAPVDCYRCPFDLEHPGCGLECAFDLERILKQEGAHTISAFIAEPVVAAAGGAPVPPPEYFPTIRDICDRYDILFIADEVVTGCGRTGRYFGVDHSGVVPDLLVVGKGLASGYAPVAGVLATTRIGNVLRQGSGFFSHGFTFGGNPVGAATALAVLDYLDAHDLVARAASTGAHLLERLQTLRALPCVGDVRGQGLLAGVELVADKASKAPFEQPVAHAVAAEAARRGLLVYPGGGTAGGTQGDHVLIAPPFTITEDEIDILVARLGDALGTLTA